MKKLVAILVQIHEELHRIRNVMESEAMFKGYNPNDPVSKARMILNRKDELKK